MITSRPTRGIGGKLVALALANAMALALLVAIAWFAYGRIEGLSATLADKEMARIFENARLGRDLATALSELDRHTRDCASPDVRQRDERPASAQLSDLARAAGDPALGRAIEALAGATQRLLGQCRSIADTRTAIDASDRQLLDELTRLEDLTSRALIEQTLAGRNTDYLDQIMALVVGYRETVMLIGKETSRTGSSPAYGKVVALIDDFRLRLQTMTAATPAMAKIARHMREDAVRYRSLVLSLQGANEKFGALQAEQQRRHEAVLEQMHRHDEASEHRAERFRAELAAVTAQTARQIAWIGGAIALLSLLLATWFVRANIQQPLAGILDRIAAIRGGSAVSAAPMEHRNDEWGTIQTALSDMADDLARTHGLLQQVVDTAPIRVFWKDRECRYLGCNPAFARDAGKESPAEIVGRDDFAMGWADQAELYRDDDRKVMKSGQSRLNYEEPQTTPDGHAIWLRTSKVPLRNASGEVIGVLGIYDDITERKNAELALQQRDHYQRALLDNFPFAVWLKDIESRFLAVNSQFVELFGATSAEALVGKTDFDIAPSDLAEGYRADDRAVLASERSKNVEEEIIDAHGARRWFETYKSPVELDGTLLGTVGFARDITERKQTEAELEHHRQHLEDLVKERTVDLVEAKGAAEAASRAKSTFLATMSHELRTPMNGVMGMLALARRRMADPQGLDHLDKAHGAAERLLGVLNDILDLSKIEAERMVLEEAPIQLGAILENIGSLLGGRARDKGLAWRIAIDHTLAREPLLGDALRLGQVLINLAGNAIKFTERGEVSVRVTAVAGDAAVQGARFEITDTGIGIDAEAQDRLFSAFEQADNSMTRKYGGTGLGLAISKRLVQMMGGEIGVESTPGAGSTFWFSVRMKRRPADSPTAGAVSPAPASGERLRQAGGGASILLAEDEPINRLVSRHLLEDAGLHVDTAEDGKEALRLSRAKRYAVILMDMQMPHMNGVEATQAIRADATNPNRSTPIVALTANAYEDDRRTCLAAGMNEFLAKPVTADHLYGTLMRAMAPAGIPG